MKNINYLLFLVLWIGPGLKVFAQSPGALSTSVYDSALAIKTGADDYGMRTYYMVFLKRGKTTVTDSLERKKIQAAHLNNIMKLAEENKLILAGPFLDNQDVRGIFIFNAASLEEVKTWVATDPAVQAGTLIAEIHPWYGSAAVMMIPEIHKSIQKKSVKD